MKEFVQQALWYLGQFEAWPWWEKVALVVSGLALLRAAWWLLEYATNEDKDAKTRTMAGVGLLVFVILLMGIVGVTAWAFS